MTPLKSKEDNFQFSSQSHTKMMTPYHVLLNFMVWLGLGNSSSRASRFDNPMHSKIISTIQMQPRGRTSTSDLQQERLANREANRDRENGSPMSDLPRRAWMQGRTLSANQLSRSYFHKISFFFVPGICHVIESYISYFPVHVTS